MNRPTIHLQHYSFGKIVHAWSGFLLLSLVRDPLGLPSVCSYLNATSPNIPVPGLHNQVFRMPPVFPHRIPNRPSSISRGWPTRAPQPSSPA